MKKRDYLPIIAILIMWLITSMSGSSTPGLTPTQTGILTLITVPLLIAIILAIRAVYKEHKAEKE
jgi:uncharacterized membrane protein